MQSRVQNISQSVNWPISQLVIHYKSRFVFQFTPQLANRQLTVSGKLTIVYASAAARRRGCVYVLHMFFCFFFAFFHPPQRSAQPFLRTAERIIVKLLPNDSWENGVSNALPKWELGPRIIFGG